jgi:hypothetical protein
MRALTQLVPHICFDLYFMVLRTLYFTPGHVKLGRIATQNFAAVFVVLKW